LDAYLSAVQVQILVPNLQLQNLHLEVPLFYDRCVPYGSLIQSWFNPSHDLRKEKKHGVGQSQDALPVDPWKEEALRGQDGSDVDGGGSIWAIGNGDTVSAQFPFPVALSVPDSHGPARRLVGTGAKHGGRRRRGRANS
uniref:Uncharacterized protein n=1 Tax=Gasterosteus aculeatus TaxID=69293 RepID=G3NV72_GASAC